MSETVTFIHLTDLHVGNPAVPDDQLFADTGAALRAALSDVKALVPKPKFIVVSGDLTNRGDAGSYENLKAIVAEAGLEMPILYALGNHDRREAFYSVMLGRNDNLAAPNDHATVISGIHVITLDTSVPGRVGGAFEPGQIDWLKAELANHADLPKLLVMHHGPALDTHDPSMEWESLSYADTENLRQVVAGKNVVGILSGHIHYDTVANWHGIPVVVATGHYAATDVLWLHEGLRMLEGAGFAICTLRPSGMSVAFAPQPTSRRELHRFSFSDISEEVKKYDFDASSSA